MMLFRLSLIVVDAVQQEVIVAGAHAIGDDGGGHPPGLIAGAVIVRTGNSARDAGNEAGQLDEIAAVQPGVP